MEIEIEADSKATTGKKANRRDVQKEMAELRALTTELKALLSQTKPSLSDAPAVSQPSNTGVIPQQSLNAPQPYFYPSATSQTLAEEKSVAISSSSSYSQETPHSSKKFFLFSRKPKPLPPKVEVKNPRTDEVVLSVWQEIDLKRCPECNTKLLKTKVLKEEGFNKQYIKCKSPKCLYQRTLTEKI